MTADNGQYKLLRDPQLSSVTRNCQINIMPLDTLMTGIYKWKEFLNCIIVKKNIKNVKQYIQF